MKIDDLKYPYKEIAQKKWEDSDFKDKYQNNRDINWAFEWSSDNSGYRKDWYFWDKINDGCEPKFPEHIVEEFPEIFRWVEGDFFEVSGPVKEFLDEDSGVIANKFCISDLFEVEQIRETPEWDGKGMMVPKTKTTVRVGSHEYTNLGLSRIKIKLEYGIDKPAYMNHCGGSLPIKGVGERESTWLDFASSLDELIITKSSNNTHTSYMATACAKSIDKIRESINNLNNHGNKKESCKANPEMDGNREELRGKRVELKSKRSRASIQSGQYPSGERSVRSRETSTRSRKEIRKVSI